MSEHRQMRRSRLSLKRGEIPAVVLAVVLAAFFLFVYFKYPDWRRPTGFGPEWECSGVGKGGASFCLKKPPADPASKTTTPN